MPLQKKKKNWKIQKRIKKIPPINPHLGVRPSGLFLPRVDSGWAWLDFGLGVITLNVQFSRFLFSA